MDTAAYCVLSIYAAVRIAVPFYYVRARHDEFRVLPHLIVPVCAALLLVVVLLAQFLFAIPPDNYPGLLPQYMGAIIAGGWLFLGIIWLVVLRARNPSALEAGERVYIEGK